MFFCTDTKESFSAAFRESQQNPVWGRRCSFLLLGRQQQCKEEASDIWLRLYRLLFPPTVVSEVEVGGQQTGDGGQVRGHN